MLINIYFLLIIIIKITDVKSQLISNTNIVESRSICKEPDIYDSETDTCLTKVNAISKTCPKNCQKHGHLCKCIDEISIQTICPDNYILSTSTKKCIKEEKAAPSIECGRGLKWSENKNVCVGVKLSTPELTCSKENSLLINGVCLTYEKKNIQNICEEGFIKKEKQEVIVSNVKLNTRGIKNSFQNNHEDIKISSYCVREISSAYSLECPDGFLVDKESSSCIAQIFSDPEPECLNGFEYDYKTEVCISKTLGEPANRVCPKDYVLEGFQCVQSSFVKPEPRCREGFIFSVEEGACIKILREPPSFRCPSDSYIFDGKQCELRKIEKSTIVCSNGTILDEKMQKCVKKSAIPAKMTCSGGRQYDEVKRKCYVIQVQNSNKICSSGEKYDKEKDRCIKYEEKKAEKGCPYGFVLNEVEQMCIQENFEEPKLYCKTPFSLVGGDCLYNAEVNPEYVCPEKFEYNEQKMECVLQVSIQPEYGCPDDYNEYIDKCIKQIERNPLSVCPPNSKLNTITNECFIIKRPYKECPLGYKPTNESITQCILVNNNGVQAHVNNNNYYFNNNQNQLQIYQNEHDKPQFISNNINSQYQPIQVINMNDRISDPNSRAYTQNNIKTAPKPRINR